MQNIIERCVVPYNPSQNKVHLKDKYYLFAPLADINKIGLAGYNPEHFLMQNGIVSLSDKFVNRTIVLENNVQRMQSDVVRLQRDTATLRTDVDEIEDKVEWLQSGGGGTHVIENGVFVKEFNADTKLDVSTFEKFDDRISALLKQTEIITVEERLNNNFDNHTADVVDGSRAALNYVLGASTYMPNVIRLGEGIEITDITEGDYKLSFDVKENLLTLTPNGRPPVLESSIFRCIGSWYLPRGQYTFLVHHLTTQNVKNVEFAFHYYRKKTDGSDTTDTIIFKSENYKLTDEGVTFSITEDAYCAVYVIFNSLLSDTRAYYLQLKQGADAKWKNARFSGIRTEARNMILPIDDTGLDKVGTADISATLYGDTEIIVDVNEDVDSLSYIELSADERHFEKGTYKVSFATSPSPIGIHLHRPYDSQNFFVNEDVEIGEGNYRIYLSIPAGTKKGQYVVKPSLQRYGPNGDLVFNAPFVYTELPIGKNLSMEYGTLSNTYAEYTFNSGYAFLINNTVIKNEISFRECYLEGTQMLLKSDMSETKPFVSDRFKCIYNINDLTEPVTTLMTPSKASGNLRLYIPLIEGTTESDVTGTYVDNLVKGMTIRYPTTPENTDWYKTEDFNQLELDLRTRLRSYTVFRDGREQRLVTDILPPGIYRLSNILSKTYNGSVFEPHIVLELFDIKTGVLLEQHELVEGVQQIDINVKNACRYAIFIAYRDTDNNGEYVTELNSIYTFAIQLLDLLNNIDITPKLYVQETPSHCYLSARTDTTGTSIVTLTIKDYVTGPINRAFFALTPYYHGTNYEYASEYLILHKAGNQA